MGETRAQFLAKIGQQAGEPGRNTKYDPEYCGTIRKLAQAGKFPETWACTIGVSVETLRRWGHEHPEFRDALIISKRLLGHYWTERIASRLDNPQANPAMYALLARRLPALFGKEPVDLAEHVTRPPDAEDEPKALSEDRVKAADTGVLEERLAVLRRRREEEGG